MHGSGALCSIHMVPSDILVSPWCALVIVLVDGVRSFWGDSEAPRSWDTVLDCVTIFGACQAMPSSTQEDWCHLAMLGVTSVLPTMLC